MMHSLRTHARPNMMTTGESSLASLLTFWGTLTYFLPDQSARKASSGWMRIARRLEISVKVE
jgi:hypothetical protein